MYFYLPGFIQRRTGGGIKQFLAYGVPATIHYPWNPMATLPPDGGK
jgi:hypothetical protein|tara:strand:- start:895 stop:1032 length:138 start_codon:yes stop_codon:yes gene_type:complete